MKKIKLGDKDVAIMATPFTPYIYKKNFGQSFTGDLLKLQSMGEDISNFDDVNTLQLIWAMAKTADNNLEDFESWLKELNHLDIFEPLEDVINEGLNATFHSLSKTNKKTAKDTK